MRLLNCHIENFGKLSDRTFTFSEGLNTICLENGAGKSTLAAFIRIMFYGFIGENKRDELENERKYYSPWQGGVYGGTLSFEVNGKSYEIERVFGQKAKDDSYVLRNADTGLKSEDYTENIGEELFGINSESFVRSVYIAQNSCESETSDSINAKMGNLVDNTDDLNCYENVMAALKDITNKLSTKKNGELGRIKSQISELSVKVKGGDGLDDAITGIIKKSEQQKEEYETLKNRQNVLREKLKAVSVYKDKKALKDRYEAFLKQEQARKNALDEIRKDIKGKLPSKEELSKEYAKLEKYTDLKGSLAGYEGFNLEENKARNEEVEAKLNKYELKFASGIPTESEIGRLIAGWEKRSEAKNSIKQRKDTLQTLMAIDDDKKAGVEEQFMKKAKTLLIMAIVLLVIGAGVVGAACAGAFRDGKLMVIAIGTMAAVIGVVLLVLSTKKKKEGSNIVFPANPHILVLRKEIDEDEILMRETIKETEDFFIRYHLNFDEYTVVNELFALKGDIANYEELKVHGKQDIEKNKIRQEKYKELKSEYMDIESSLKAYVKELGYDDNISIREALDTTREVSVKYESALNEYELAKKSREDFEKVTPEYETLKELVIPEDEESMEANEKELHEINTRLEAISKFIESYKRELDDFSTKKDEIAGFENEIINLKEEQQKISEKLDIAEKTKLYMEEAKIALTNKYTGPITESFNKYYKMLEKDGDIDKYSFDAHISLSFKEQGKLRSTKTLSQGLKDLSGIALRMAFADTMYKDEKPFVVLDDPYVNLDKSRLDGGMDMLKQLSKDHQIIYFTCHDSRAVRGEV